jgi:hypothetical protein
MLILFAQSVKQLEILDQDIVLFATNVLIGMIIIVLGLIIVLE